MSLPSYLNFCLQFVFAWCTRVSRSPRAFLGIRAKGNPPMCTGSLEYARLSLKFQEDGLLQRNPIAEDQGGRCVFHCISSFQFRYSMTQCVY
ncbi:hypothetical protein B0H34DRAFT_509787 [Crassisporium funariophilum]|nr:hypothetical protein B0H34DRAFT_509787 [Crassisporium funariophilum]